MSDVRIIRGDGVIKVISPYHADLVSEFHRLVPDAEECTFQSGAWLFDAKHAGKVVLTTKRFFPQAREERDPTPRQGRIQFVLEYLGRCKEDAAMGTSFASAQADGAWKYKIAESVLKEYFGSLGDEESYYSLLGCRRTDTKDEIKRAYYRAVKIWHPDRNKDADAPAKFKEVATAYQVLSDPADRAKYEKGLALAEMLRELKSGVSKKTLKRKQMGYRAPRTCGVVDAEVEAGIKRQLVTKIYGWTDDVQMIGGVKKLRIAHMRYDKMTGGYNLVTEWEATW